MESVREILERLNNTDEVNNLEAKRGTAVDRSIMETVCAFSNEPGLGGGTILLGVVRDETMLFPYYKATGVQQSDKIQLDFATQAASLFNIPIRPEIEVEPIKDGVLIVKIFVPELPDAQKPVYFKNEGLPRGAYRRIAGSDQRCTEDDLYIFFHSADSFDNSIVGPALLEDISEEAVAMYRALRTRVNPEAEELKYSDNELLWSLGCLQKENGKWQVTYAGLLVFGRRMALRRLLPMVRVDYIRVPGNEWVADPENRFTTVDMRGPLIELVQRTITAIADDLPKGFLLHDHNIQAESIGLPAKVLREAIVNAFIHRSYRVNQPIQVIRYGNRIEIKNPGFSLKPEDNLGEPGSMNRNPFIASIFHETNLAETKGSGIRTMRRLMDEAKMVPPTFESDHSGNEFTIRLLLHHLVSEEDILWLKEFQHFGLSDAQKRALIFVRETGAADNPAYRQINGCDSLKASSDLRQMRDLGILQQKGKSRSTYYIPDQVFYDPGMQLTRPESEIRQSLSDNPPPAYLTTPPRLSDNPPGLPDNPPGLSDNLIQLKASLPAPFQQQIQEFGKRIRDKERMIALIIDLCRWKPLTIKELSFILSRNEKYMYSFITPLRESGRLTYTIPEMPNHPDQAYKTID